MSADYMSIDLFEDLTSRFNKLAMDYGVSEVALDSVPELDIKVKPAKLERDIKNFWIAASKAIKAGLTADKAGKVGLMLSRTNNLAVAGGLDMYEIRGDNAFDLFDKVSKIAEASAPANAL